MTTRPDHVYRSRGLDGVLRLAARQGHAVIYNPHAGPRRPPRWSLVRVGGYDPEHPERTTDPTLPERGAP